MSPLASDIVRPDWTLTRKHKSGRYYGAQGVLSSAVIVQGDERLCPFWVPEVGAYDRIVAEITTLGEAGSLLRLGIRQADPDTGEPLGVAPLVDAGTVAGDAATGAKELTINVTLPAGPVWLTSVAQACPTTAPGQRALTTSLHPTGQSNLATAGSQGGVWQKSGVTGALPTWDVFNPTGATLVPKLWLRKA